MLLTLCEDGNYKYEGEFKDNVMSGKGIYYFPNGDRYEGEFLDNKRTGRGIMIYASGDKIEGNFLNGKLVDNTKEKQ